MTGPERDRATSEPAPAHLDRPSPGVPNPVPILIVTGLFWGGLEGFVLHDQWGPTPVRMMAASLATLPAALIGLVVWGLFALARRRPLRGPWQRVAAWAARVTDREAAAREPIIALHAWLTLALATVAVAAGAAFVVAGRLMGLQEQALARALVTIMAVGLACVPLLLMPLGRRTLTALYRAIDARVRLPLPPFRALRYLIYVAAPLTAIAVPFLRSYDLFIGLGATAVSLAILCSWAPLVGYLWRFLRPSPLRFRRIIGWGVVALCPLGLVATGFGYARAPRAATAAEVGRTPALGAALVRALTDVDFDGSSSLYAGGDCAPVDGRRGPLLMDLPDNGIDEDCDGRDRTAMKGVVPKVQQSGKLTGRQVRRYSIVWVILEAVRADRIQTFGHDRPTMPNFDELAKESLVFTQAYSQASATNFSVPSMLIGKNPAAIEWEKKTKRLRPVLSEVKVAQRLKTRGYRTGFVLANRNTLLNVQPGYDWLGSLIVEGEEPKLWIRRGAPITFARAVEFLSEKAPRAKLKHPLFLTVYFPDAHSPYRRHRDVDLTAFPRDELGNYDAELRFTDVYLGLLLDYLRSRTLLWDDLVVIVTADHGEEFREHGGKRHAYTCHVESVHVPLIVRIPGIAPRRVDTPVGLIDIVPTLLELLGVPVTGDLHGQSLLVPALNPEADPEPRAILCSVASQMRQRGAFFRRAVRSDGFCLMEEVNRKQHALYDLASDPGEQVDVANDPAHQDRLKALQAVLAASRTGNMQAWPHFKGRSVD